MLYAPLVMPEVISGLSLLLLFVALNAERGFWTVTIAHTTLTMCFVTVVVQSRLASLDRSLEEAAMDLGCDPVRAFVAVTLPLIVPAIAAGWMLAFTLSLDDVVIASFTTGPGSATLPIRIYSEVRLGREARDQRDLHHGDRADRGGDRDRLAGLEAVELARRERGAAVSRRHCERSEAIHLATRGQIWIASSLSLLAMTPKATFITTSPRPPSVRRPCSA